MTKGGRFGAIDLNAIKIWKSAGKKRSKVDCRGGVPLAISADRLSPPGAPGSPRAEDRKADPFFQRDSQFSEPIGSHFFRFGDPHHLISTLPDANLSTSLCQQTMLRLIPSVQLPKRVSPRRPFLLEEDARLMQILPSRPFLNWDSVAQQFPGRTARQCRERWLGYLSPAVRTGPWSEDEDRNLVAMVSQYGRSWSVIKRLFNGRSENDIKNRWYSHLRIDAVQGDGSLALPATRPERRRRRRAAGDPKWNALRLLEAQAASVQSSPVCSQEGVGKQH